MVKQGTPTRPPHVLIVDDEPLMRRTTSRLLRSEGYEVDEACSAVEAREMLGSQPWDLMLLDHHLSSESGLDLLRQLRDQPETVTLPVIVVTGSTEVKVQVEILNAGADDLIIKPFEVEIFLARVSLQLNRKARVEEQIRSHSDEPEL
jgi:DNA-binding response OmpR family regulator